MGEEKQKKSNEGNIYFLNDGHLWIEVDGHFFTICLEFCLYKHISLQVLKITSINPEAKNLFPSSCNRIIAFLAFCTGFYRTSKSKYQSKGYVEDRDLRSVLKSNLYVTQVCSWLTGTMFGNKVGSCLVPHRPPCQPCSLLFKDLNLY